MSTHTSTGWPLAGRSVIALAAVMLGACHGASAVQTMPASTQAVHPPVLAVRTVQEQSAPVADATSAGPGLSDLDAMTFSCPKAGLNAAAREAAKVPSQGTYQFSYFRIVNDSHHASYEVHFKSNYDGEADLKYCVSIYCQQGWDPKTTKTSVTLVGNDHARGESVAHGADCGLPQTSVKPRPKR